jgi:ribose-phosphate pyrophosphokinase
VVVATDAGAGKIADAFANELKLPMAIIDKRRTDDNETARAVSVIGDVRGKNAIIYDDEIATGGSIEEAAAILRTFGAKRIRVGVTHPVLSGPAVERLTRARLDELVVTDTIPIPPEKARALPNLKVLSTAKLFADAIRAIHTNTSVSATMHK